MTLTVFFARKKDELGVSLNEVQMKAVLQTEGAVTFSQDSAADMRNRFKRFFPDLKPGISFCPCIYRFEKGVEN
jgi:hypothetical protein